MRRLFYLSKLHLIIGWGLVTAPYLMIKFGVVLLENIPNAKIWNEIGEAFFLTISTSLLFWFVAEWLAGMLQHRKVIETQRSFLNEALRLYNVHVHSLKGGVLEEDTVIPSYIDTITTFQIEQLTDEWTLRSAGLTGQPRASLEEGSHRRVKHLINNLRELRSEYDPYHALFSMEYNKAVNELFRTTRFFMNDGRPESLRGGITLLSVLRQRLVAVENVHRKQVHEPEMKVPRKSLPGGPGVRQVIVP